MYLRTDRTMYVTASVTSLSFGLCLVSNFVMGLGSQISEGESILVNEVLQDLPPAECDTISVSTFPLKGKMPLPYKQISRSIEEGKYGK